MASMARLSLLIVLCLVGVSGVLAVECVTPREWQPKLTGTPRDLNGDFIDDSIDSTPPGTLVDITLDLNRCAERPCGAGRDGAPRRHRLLLRVTRRGNDAGLLEWWQSDRQPGQDARRVSLERPLRTISLG